MFKSNYMIVFVAMVIFILFDIILNKKYTSIILLILFVPAYFASSMIPNTIIKNITGIELGKGIPMISQVMKKYVQRYSHIQKQHKMLKEKI